MNEKITLTKEMVEKVALALKHATYDGNKLEIEIGPIAPCSVLQAFMPDILDLGLKELKIKTQYQTIDLFVEPEKPRVNPKDVKQKVLVRTWP